MKRIQSRVALNSRDYDNLQGIGVEELVTKQTLKSFVEEMYKQNCLEIRSEPGFQQNEVIFSIEGYTFTIEEFKSIAEVVRDLRRRFPNETKIDELINLIFKE